MIMSYKSANLDPDICIWYIYMIYAWLFGNKILNGGQHKDKT
jgi:hypothetical protein